MLPAELNLSCGTWDYGKSSGHWYWLPNKFWSYQLHTGRYLSLRINKSGPKSVFPTNNRITNYEINHEWQAAEYIYSAHRRDQAHRSFVSDYCQLHGMFRMLDQNPGTMCYPRWCHPSKLRSLPMAIFQTKKKASSDNWLPGMLIIWVSPAMKSFL